MSAIASQITGVAIVYSTFCSGADQRKHPSSASLAFVRGIHRWPVNFPRKGPVTRKMFPFDDVIMSPKEVTLYIQNAMDPTRFRIHDITQHAFSTLSEILFVCVLLVGSAVSKDAWLIISWSDCNNCLDGASTRTVVFLSTEYLIRFSEQR